MSEWRECTLGEVLELKRGYDLPTRLRTAGPFPVVSSSGVTGTHKEAKVKGPGVATGRYGTLGEVFYIDGDFWPLNTTLYVRDFKGNDPKFIGYFLRTIDFFAYSDKAAVPGVNRNHLHQAPVVVPDLQTQQKIAHILGTLDDKIELNRRMNRTLEAIARAIFKSWFIGFDPVHAKAEGREPVGMDPETAALFPNSLQDSPLGKIPEGWEVSPFSKIVEVSPIRTLKKGQVAPYVDMASLPTSGSQLDAPPSSREYKSGSRFRNGDVLFARITPCLENGKTVLVDFLGEGQIGAGSTEFLVFGPRVAGTYYAYCASRWKALREHAIASMTGTSGRQRAQKGAFDHFEMAVPGSGLLQAFETRVTPMFVAQHSASMESRRLSAIRDSLLPHLLSGKLSATPQEESS